MAPRRKPSVHTRTRSKPATRFTSPGQIALDPATGNLVEGDFSGQARRVFENLRAVLQAAGTDFTRVVKATVNRRQQLPHAQLDLRRGSRRSHTGEVDRGRRAASTRRRGRNRFDCRDLTLIPVCAGDGRDRHPGHLRGRDLHDLRGAAGWRAPRRQQPAPLL